MVIADYTGVAAGSLTDLVFVHGRVLMLACSPCTESRTCPCIIEVNIF